MGGEELSYEQLQGVALLMRTNTKNDCRFDIGDTVVKVKDQDDDAHPIGTEGTVEGYLSLDAFPQMVTEGETEVYMVRFDGDNNALTFIVGSKIDAKE